jgi:Rad3-related DNA helicase
VRPPALNFFFLRSCEGEAANMESGTGIGKSRSNATPLLRLAAESLETVAN